MLEDLAKLKNSSEIAMKKQLSEIVASEKFDNLPDDHPVVILDKLNVLMQGSIPEEMWDSIREICEAYANCFSIIRRMHRHSAPTLSGFCDELESFFRSMQQTSNPSDMLSQVKAMNDKISEVFSRPILVDLYPKSRENLPRVLRECFSAMTKVVNVLIAKQQEAQSQAMVAADQSGMEGLSSPPNTPEQEKEGGIYSAAMECAIPVSATEGVKKVPFKKHEDLLRLQIWRQRNLPPAQQDEIFSRLTF